MNLNFITYPHGSIKWLLESSQGLLLRQPELEVLLLGATGLLLISMSQRIDRFRIGGWILLVLLILSTPYYGTLGLVITCLLLVPRFLSESWSQTGFLGKISKKSSLWMLFSWLLTPQWEVQRIRGGLSKSIYIISSLGMALTILCLWQWLDVLSHYDAVRKDMEHWPIDRLDSNITEIAHSPPGVRADWHGVRIIDDTAIVTCERKPRLMAFHLLEDHFFEYPLKPRWGIENVGPLETEVDVKSHLAWTVNGGDKLVETKLKDDQWLRYREIRLPSALSFSYITRSAESLFITEVQTSTSNGSRKLLKIPLPTLSPISEVHLKMNGEQAPMPREALWVPTIQKLIYASEIDSQLYAVDVQTGDTKPWLAAPTFNGKMLWSEETNRIYLAVPNQMKIVVINPMEPSIDYELWTQPEVRAIAVDSKRRMILSASVLTGQIWVQDLDSGSILKRMGTVYPMVREMALHEDKGLGVLTTWNAVYKFTYD